MTQIYGTLISRSILLPGKFKHGLSRDSDSDPVVHTHNPPPSESASDPAVTLCEHSTCSAAPGHHCKGNVLLVASTECSSMIRPSCSNCPHTRCGPGPAIQAA